MLPESRDLPSGLRQALVRVSVASPVRRELLAPPGAIGVWFRAMHWAAVPETAIDEDGDFLFRKHDICPAPRLRDRTHIDSVTHTESVEGRPDSHLRPGVTPTRRAHPLCRSGG